MCLVFLYGIKGTAQNLVPNPDFESYINCPLVPMYCPFANNGAQQTATSWFSALSTSSDYFNGCAPNLQYQVPNNIFYGYIPPHSGVGCVGINAYGEFQGSNTPQTSYREYVECQLTQPLSAGVTYKLSMWVRSLYRVVLQPGANFSALAALEASFSTTALTNITSPIPAPAIPVQKPSAGFITDTTWVQISALYTATGGEDHLTLGTFNDPNNTRPSMTHLFPIPANPGVDLVCYYLIDDVELVAKGLCDTNTAAHNTVLCSEDGLELDPAFAADAYTWNTGITAATLVINTPGTYWRIATTGCDAQIDTFHVSAYQDTVATVSLIDDLCGSPKEITLNSKVDNAEHYNWNTSEKTASIQITEPGVYTCTAQKDCILYIDTFKVASPRIYTSSIPKEVCFPFELAAIVTGADSIVWSDQQKGSGITIDKPGVYIYRAYKECAIYIDSFVVTSKSKTDSIDLGRDITDCKNTETTIGKVFPDVTNYLWNTGETTYSIHPKETGYYTVTVDNGCVLLSDSIKVEKVRCDDCIFLPTAFTPDNDGRNDQLKAIANCPLGSFYLIIYNRFGQLMFTSWNIQDKWDGTYKGTPVEMGVYYYMLQYTTLGDAKQHTLKGDITIVY